MNLSGNHLPEFSRKTYQGLINKLCKIVLCSHRHMDVADGTRHFQYWDDKLAIDLWMKGTTLKKLSVGLHPDAELFENDLFESIDIPGNLVPDIWSYGGIFIWSDGIILAYHRGQWERYVDEVLYPQTYSGGTHFCQISDSKLFRLKHESSKSSAIS